MLFKPSPSVSESRYSTCPYLLEAFFGMTFGEDVSWCNMGKQVVDIIVAAR